MKLPLAGNLRVELLIGLTLRGLGAVASFVLAWIIARAYGPAAYGLFQLGLTTAMFFFVAASMGLDRLTIRTVSVALDQGRAGDGATAYRIARNRQLIVAALAVLLIFAGAGPFADSVLREPSAAPFLRAFAPVALTITLMFLCAGVLRSSGRIVLSQSLDGVTYTSITAIVIALAWATNNADDPLLPAAVYACSTALVLLVGLVLCERMVSKWGSGSARVPVLSGLFIAAPNLLTRLSDWIAIVLLTALASAAETGIYRIAFQICLLFMIVNTSFATMVGPRIAAAAARGDATEVKRTIRTSSLFGMAVCLPLLLVALVFPREVLALFGQEFVEGATALRVLAIGQFINVAFGPLGEALAMMHRERANLVIAALSVGTGLAIAALTIPVYGMVGAAAALSIQLILFKGIAWIVLHRSLRNLASAPDGSPQNEPA